MSIRKYENMKKIIPISISILLYLICFGFYANYKLSSEREQSYVKLSNQLKNELNNEKRLSRDTGIINAISIAENVDIQNALLNNNREPAIKILQKLKKDYAQKTSIKNLKVHIHTKDTRSFIRSWKLNKFGDDLSGFRKAIVGVKMTHQPFFGFEVGRMGLTLRSIVPIIHKGKFIGSLEFIQNFDNIVKTFKRDNYNYLLLMDKSLLKIAKYLKNAPKIGPYILSSRDYNKNFLKISQLIDFDKLKKDEYLITDKYFYTYEYIKNAQNTNVGMHLLAMPVKILTAQLNKNKKDLLISMATNTFFLFLILGVIAILSILVSSSRQSN